MASNRSYTLIGAFLLGVIVLATVGVLVFGGSRVFSNERAAIVFFDQSVLGLHKGSRVLFRGVQVGTVKNIELRFDPNAGHARIAVTISVTGQSVSIGGDMHPSTLSVRDLVGRGLRAQLVVYSYVTSELAVNLGFYPDTEVRYAVKPAKLDVAEIPAQQSQIQQIKNQIMDLPWQATLARVNKTMQSLISLADNANQALAELTPELTRTTHSARATLDTVRGAIKANNQQLQATIATVQKLAANANEASRSANKQIQARGDQLAQVLASANRTSDKLSALATHLNGLTAPRGETRQSVDNILKDLSASAANLRQFTQNVERNPQRLLYGGGR